MTEKWIEEFIEAAPGSLWYSLTKSQTYLKLDHQDIMVVELHSGRILHASHIEDAIQIYCHEIITG